MGSEDEAVRELGRGILEDNESRLLCQMPDNKDTGLANLLALGPAQSITAAPQTTIGIPLDHIIYALDLVPKTEIILGDNKPDKLTVSLGANQKERPTLVSAHDATLEVVKDLEEKNPGINKEDWIKLEGVIGLAASYIRTARINRNTYSYIKEMAPMMSRVNFSTLYKELPDNVRCLFNSTNVAKAAGINEDGLLFGPKGALSKRGKIVPGPTVEEWISSIVYGKDALSLLGKEFIYGTDEFIGGSESMGQYSELDKKDTVHKVPLVPIELREMSKKVPLGHWMELAVQIMNFSDRLLK